MMRIFVNALGASAGGGLTYIRNTIPHLASCSDVNCTVLVGPRLCQELRAFSTVTFIERDMPARLVQRMWSEQRTVAELIVRHRADVLLSAGNFALWNSPVPQILLSRNSLYTSRDFDRDVKRRGDYRLWLDTQMKGAFAKWSVRIADCAIAPSMAFAAELEAGTGKRVLAVHHGFDPEMFTSNGSPLPDRIAKQMDSCDGALRLLFVSHYNYYRNFETLIRALPLISQRIKPRPLRLILTCRLAPNANPGAYLTDSTAAMVRNLGLAAEVVELGTVPYDLLHQLYRRADIYVTAAYAESFAHPLVEAMASGVPVIASDLPVHKEICWNAALFFPRFSHGELADTVCGLVNEPELAADLIQRGLKRSADFSWKVHVEKILSLSRQLLSRNSR